MGEALRIHYTQDNILNSKSEYRSNTITRLAIEEDAWERRERSRLEEEEDRLAKEMVDQFRRNKTAGWSSPTGQTLEYETDEDEFASEEDCHQLMKYEPEPSILPEGSRLDTTLAVPALLKEDHRPISTRPSNAQRVTLGQSKRSPGDPLMNISGVSQVQHEHPWLKVVHEGEDESGNVAPGYETDEDEFAGGEEPSILPEGSRLDTTLAVTATAPPGVRKVRRVKRRTFHTQSGGYSNSSLGYFSLWWGRMEREAARDMMNIQRESVRCRQEEMLRSMMISGRKTEVSGREGSITIAETERDMHRDIYGQSQADQAPQTV